MLTIAKPIKDRNHLFYILGAIAIVVIVLAGFTKTYYLKFAFGTPALTPLVNLHGIVMTLWVVLFLVQTWLVASHRTHIHRRLGIFGAILAAAVLVVGTTTGIVAAKLGHSPGPPPLVFLVVPLGDMVIFGTLVSIGLYFRRKSDIHKRLMLLASLSLLTAAIARIPLEFIHSGGIPVYFGLTDLCILICVVYDTVRLRRLHPAFTLGVILIIASQPLRLMLAGTQAWMQFANWLVR